MDELDGDAESNYWYAGRACVVLSLSAEIFPGPATESSARDNICARGLEPSFWPRRLLDSRFDLHGLLDQKEDARLDADRCAPRATRPAMAK